MNIKEMYSLAERLLSEGVDPNTPICFSQFEIQYDSPIHIAVEIGDVKLVDSGYNTSNDKREYGPILLLTDGDIQSKDIDCYRQDLTIPKFSDFKEILTRKEPAVAPTEFVLTPPVFDGPQKQHQPVTHPWLFELINRRVFRNKKSEGFSPDMLPGCLEEGDWVTAEFEGTATTNNFYDIGRGFYVQTGTDDEDTDAPVYLHFSGHSHDYLVNLRTRETKVRLYCSDKWETWDDRNKKVSDVRDAVEANLEEIT